MNFINVMYCKYKKFKRHTIKKLDLNPQEQEFLLWVEENTTTPHWRINQARLILSALMSLKRYYWKAFEDSEKYFWMRERENKSMIEMYWE